MWQKEKKYYSILSLATLLALASTPVAVTFFVSIAVAQTAKEQFPLPSNIPSGTTVKIDGSSSMARINDNLKQSFEQQFSGTKVEVATNGTDAAISALLDGKVDLAAMGRGLTSEEEAKGLEQYRLRREKIAIVVGENNPFKGNLTDRQFAKIFRGEITDWSQISGTKGKIRFIDRPASSDTREAFRNYPVFKGNFATGSAATQLSEDSSTELAKQLGTDGIGYALANQVSKIPGLRVLKLHETLPNDSKYPFSQPLVYAYKKNPNPGVAGFLGFSASDPGTKAVEAARNAEAVAIAQNLSETSATANTAVTATPANAGTTQTATTSPTVSATTTPGRTDAATNTSAVSGTANQSTTNNQSNQAFLPNGDVATTETRNTFPWWLLLPLVALGGAALWWLLGRRNNQEVLEASPSAASMPIADIPEVSISPPSDRAFLDSSNNLNTATLASGAVVGAGLWSRLTRDGGNISNQNIPLEAELTNSGVESADLEEPLAVVMPSYSELHSVSQVDVNDESNAIEEPVIDVELPNANTTSENSSNWLDNMTASGGAGAGLWSSTNDSESNNQTQFNPAVEVPSANYSSPEAPEVPPTQLPDVLQDTRQPQGDSNWFDKPSLADSAGAGLWSRFANRDNDNEPRRVTIISSEEASDIPEIEFTPAAGNLSEVPNVPEVEFTSAAVNAPDVPDIPFDDLTPAAVNVPEVTEISAIDTPQIDEVPAVEVKSFPEPLPDVWEETPEDEYQASNWLNNVTLTGGATAVGAGLWSRFSNQNRGNEVTDETISNRKDKISNDTTPIQDQAVTETINPNVPTTELIEATEPVANLEAPAIKDALPSETKLDNLGTIEDPVLAGGIASRNWWTPDGNEANTESTEIDLPASISTAEVPTEEIPSQVIEIASADVSRTEQLLDVQQYSDSEVVTDLDIELPNISETAFDEVADAAEAEVVMETENDVDTPLYLATPDTISETGIDAATIAGDTAIAGGITAALQLPSSERSDNTDVNVIQTTNVETPVIVTTNDSPSSIVNNAASTISLNPRTPKWAYATWNITDTDRESKRQEGGTQLILRLYDVTDMDLSYQAPQLVQQYECEETIKNRFVAIPISDRDYMAEIGYSSIDDRWLPITRSHVARIFSRPHQEFWFEADAELIVHGATEPGSTVTVGGYAVKIKPDGTFHLRIPFTEELIDYVMTAVASDGEKAKTIHMHFSQENPK